MEGSGTASDAFIKVKQALMPYIKSRQEASRIRRVLAAHLDSQFEYKAGHPSIPPLSLPSDSIGVRPNSAKLQGLQKDYVKSVHANNKAHQEYNRLCDAVTRRIGESRPQRTVTTDVKYPTTSLPEQKEILSGYIDLVRQRQRHERLRIMQDYLNRLEQKFALATSYLDQPSTNSLRLPKCPVDVLTISGANNPESARRDLLGLTVDLERAVLRAKIQLRHEKAHLEQARGIRSSNRQREQATPRGNADNLQALGRTRDELIGWIEEELGKAGESSPHSQDEKSLGSQPRNMASNVQRLSSIKAQYSHYIDLRTKFLERVSNQSDHDVSLITPSAKGHDLESPEKENAPIDIRVALPLLKDLLSISNEQKSLMQQKSYLTVSLAKQHKETHLTFDRLLDESHLLPAFALSTRKASRRGLGQGDEDELLGKEMPDTAHRARSWVQSADLASSTMKDAVLSNLEEGELAIEGARELLLKLEQLVPRNMEHSAKGDTDSEDIWMSDRRLARPIDKRHEQAMSSSSAGDIWASLDGNLGVLQADHGG